MPVVLPKGTWEPAGSGESDTEVFRRGDGAVYAKCAALRGIEELRAERDRVVWLSGTGIPGAEVADWIETDDGACLLTTAVPGIAAVDLPPSSRLKAVEVLAEALRGLHELADCPFTRPLAEVVAQATDVVRRGAVNPDFLTDEWRRERPEDLLAQIQADRPYADAQAAHDLVVCHGDPCLPNVLLDPGTLEITGFIDVGRLGLADRYADLALTTAQLGDEWDLDPASFHAAYGLDAPDQRRLVFYRLLDSLSWG
ncbi:Antimicrobial 3''-kinase [Kribbella flavida DSM 17836]|uniref:Antimicrobial 3''-kinase n=1 Tax=Kribbella flavida (strain DSM 17836 / JCM 10339 / NBRC 14399) TaxID=479435 RepID=D2PKR4_KRIFD|nr:aminoglycoside 3'-phosphotransferase [Kribbella flavida]ADB32381.1 Antimicrobial 3''-kinase [Kribbella flavida DSM 17836]